ncbi:MAG TPA: phospholipase D-like domain-containing protein [Ignavibacteria bacterium]
MILHNEDLARELRNVFDTAKHRIWIAVPFIGSWNYVERIIGNNWITQKNIDVRLIIDIRNENFIWLDTFDIFRQCAGIKTLAGLHAKVYIIDDFMLLTSANLTGAAFSKRYEIGIKLMNDKSILKIFGEWWDKAEEIENSWMPTKKYVGGNHEPEDSDTSRLKKLWDLPKISRQQNGFTEYALIVNAYNNFVKLYEKHAERLIPKLPVYQEIDGFFNYLYHEHPETPSNEYMDKPFRIITEKERIKELSKYFKQFKKWLERNPVFEDYRYNFIKTIHEKLSKSNIRTLTKQDITEVVDCLHCMRSMAINKHKFLNPLNNDIEVIKKEWESLLHNNTIGLEERMETCNRNLRSFGKSSIRELIGWFNPDKYPIVNRNSNSGMKFFGYDIKTY